MSDTVLDNIEFNENICAEGTVAISKSKNAGIGSELIETDFFSCDENMEDTTEKECLLPKTSKVTETTTKEDKPFDRYK